MLGCGASVVIMDASPDYITLFILRILQGAFEVGPVSGMIYIVQPSLRRPFPLQIATTLPTAGIAFETVLFEFRS
ncbi:uncharacterized protein BT62DRAFT_1010382 [Guyanagaster necrorhizus]|uniref:Uncharacterized protein n=1 Tax=Guyanagaster necrorhizus TaxID=856835 RepID=A0A9P7VKL0_9AGAR|nr:uncharacterized protein BT62DRAFT_1010382 [Guyanagaster necrorhizus MCA 3950]KAG7442434.1 hypothetical protein BT62DRAFT_1010382 [Guyanagaster necrorhizus MCA 3950]